MKRFGIFVALTTACARPPDDALPAAEQVDAEVTRSPADDAPQGAGLRPQWRVGDSWLVRYRMRAIPGTRGRPLGYAEFDWEHRVVDIDDLGRVTILARYLRMEPRAEKVPNRWGDRRLVFGRNAQLLKVNAQIERLSFTAPPNVYFSDEPLEWAPIAHEWPQFPLVENADVRFEEGFGQQVTRTDRGLRVTLRRYSDDADDEFDIKTQNELEMDQVWEQGRPWWSTLRISGRSIDDGLGRESVRIEGRVVEWHFTAQD